MFPKKSYINLIILFPENLKNNKNALKQCNNTFLIRIVQMVEPLQAKRDSPSSWPRQGYGAFAGIN